MDMNGNVEFAFFLFRKMPMLFYNIQQQHT